MSILDQLSSKTGDRTEYSNRKVAIQCLDDPDLLAAIVDGLKTQEPALQGDCAEVLTMVAEEHAEWIVSYAGELSQLISHKNTRLRWEAMHALSLVAALTPTTIARLLTVLEQILRNDTSVIVRDHATDAIARYASTGETAAQAAYPILKDMLTLWNGKQAGHALQGLAGVARLLPSKHSELEAIAQEFSTSPKAVIRKATKGLIRLLNNP